MTMVAGFHSSANRTPSLRGAWIIVLTLVCCAGRVVGGHPGYLGIVGPTPIQFQPPAKPPPPPSNLPPLWPPPEPTTPTADANPFPPTPPPGSTSPSTNAITANPEPSLVETGSVHAPSIQTMAPHPEVGVLVPNTAEGQPQIHMPWLQGGMTPQMLLPYFIRPAGEESTVDPAVAIPLMFIPPAAQPRKPSTSVYQTQ